MNIAIIPARKKSVRIKNKNIKIFMGKPIIYWSIKAAFQTKIFDKVIVSTEDKKISKIAKNCGAEIPFYRPRHLADGKTEIIDVVKHSIKWFKKNNIKIENVCCIFATAPLLNYKNIIKAFNILKKNDCDFVFPATINSKYLTRSFYLKKNKIKMINDNFYHFRSQDLPSTYHDAGQFYWGKTRTWMKKKRIFAANSKILKIPSNESVDINTLQDWKQAKLLINKK